MTTAAIWLSFAFVLGLIVRLAGLPPLVGYLIAGFSLSALGYESNLILEEVAHAGVLVLLFSVGLKLRLRSLLYPDVMGGAAMHMLIIAPILFLVVGVIYSLEANTGMLIAVALAFSSTVITAKILESRRELRALHGRVAIGILIMQDLVAVALLAYIAGKTPSPWAFLLFAVFILRPVIHRLLDFSGHGELLVLYGLLLALVLGGASFGYFGVSAELGALLLGVVLSNHKRAVELSDALWSLKEVLLVGFFLQIGLSGHPDLDTFIYIPLLLLLLPVKAVLFFFILVMFRLRARSAFLASLSLATYSEFGLIVAQAGMKAGLLEQDWLALLAVTVALSFAIAAPLSRYSHLLYARWERFLVRFESQKPHRDDKPISLNHPDVLIIGMGRVGTGAYDYLKEHGHTVTGLDSDPVKIEQHKTEGRNAFYADAEDPGLWDKLVLDGIKAVLLATPELEAKRYVAKRLRATGFTGLISATAVYPEQIDALKASGVDKAYNYFEEVGVGFAGHLQEDLAPKAENEV
ncbi:MAG: hypothetical protein AMS22_15585 [Thiotrichales bacterium SG8_50]|nr:MAG: hypothetical protein AMS22_15585 [Thiotrichales bacterium SG8_50]